MGDETRGSEVIDESTDRSDAMELRREDEALLSLGSSEENLNAGIAAGVAERNRRKRCPALIYRKELQEIWPGTLFIALFAHLPPLRIAAST